MLNHGIAGITPSQDLQPPSRSGQDVRPAKISVSVRSVQPGSWADSQGVQAGDKILAVNGAAVCDMDTESFNAQMQRRPLTLSMRSAAGGQTKASPGSLLFWQCGGQPPLPESCGGNGAPGPSEQSEWSFPRGCGPREAPCGMEPRACELLSQRDPWLEVVEPDLSRNDSDCCGRGRPDNCCDVPSLDELFADRDVDGYAVPPLNDQPKGGLTGFRGPPYHKGRDSAVPGSGRLSPKRVRSRGGLSMF